MWSASEDDPYQGEHLKKLPHPKIHAVNKLMAKSNHEEEPLIPNMDFNVFKFNNRKRPTKKKITIMCAFSEFGCEVVGAMYCIPRVLQDNLGRYTIVVGWQGRDYLYRHLVDEFWELKDEHQWLRDYCLAFHHVSKNLNILEQSLTQYGRVYTSNYLGTIAISNHCKLCGYRWQGIEPVFECPGRPLSNGQRALCGSKSVVPSLFGRVDYHRSQQVPIPKPSEKKIALAKECISQGAPPYVAIFARGRKRYGRNLPPDFYIKLIKMVRDQGYTPIWMGEKQTTQECPDDSVIELSTRNENARDLEFALAVVCQCAFTIQFWTASTRLAGIMGVPYLLVESPGQIWGSGQEGYRLNLITQGPAKIVASNYSNMLDDQDKGLEYVKKAIEEIKEGNFNPLVGLVESEVTAKAMILQNNERIGGFKNNRCQQK